MNAPLDIKPAPRMRYGPMVDAHFPGLFGKERDMRCSLMLMRDQANAVMVHCRPEVYPVLAIVSDIANRYAIEPLPLPALEALRYQLLRLISCASGLETFDRLPEDEGGSDARG